MTQTKTQTENQKISEEIIKEITGKLEKGEGVRFDFEGIGRLSIDRPLPYLCLYRKPSDREDRGTANLILAESSHLITENNEQTLELVKAIAKTLADKFGTFLVIEVWSSDAETDEYTTASEAKFRVFTEDFEETPSTVNVLKESIKDIDVKYFRANVEHISGEGFSPPGVENCFDEDEIRRLGCLMIGLEVSPIYRDAKTEELYSTTLRHLRENLTKALQATFFEFVCVQTSERPTKPQMLGRRSIDDATWSADEELCALGDKVDYLHAVTPVNSNQAFHEFKASGCETEPDFHYRLLIMNHDDLKRKLYAISFDDVEDPTMLHLLMDKRTELDRQITLIGDRNTPRFLYESLQLFPPVEDDLLETAKEILAIPKTGKDTGERFNAEKVAELARKEVEHYKGIYPKMTATVEVRDDIPSGLMVSSGNVNIGHNSSISEKRVNALIQHEVGTHSVTYFNGRSQPLKLLYMGMPGYEQLQEGLAVFAEYLVGGLNLARMRTLAARVIAVEGLTNGKNFAEVFDDLHNTYKFTKRGAFNITMRVFRGGGLTKDAVYLRGLIDVLKFIKNGGDINTLFIGKMGIEHISMIEELQMREVLKQSPLTPRYMKETGAEERLERARKGISVTELV